MRKQWKRKAENQGGCCRPCLWGKWANLVEHARSALFTLIGVYSFAKVKEPQSGSQTSKKSPPVLFSPAPVIAATPLQRIYIYKCKEIFIKTSRNEVKGRKKNVFCFDSNCKWQAKMKKERNVNWLLSLVIGNVRCNAPRCCLLTRNKVTRITCSFKKVLAK